MLFARTSQTMTLAAARRDLGDSDPRVRARAADALGRLQEERTPAIDLLRLALADRDPAVRYAALLSLGELAAASALPEVAARLSDEEPLCREAATIALGQLGSEAAWGPLEAALASPEPEVRFQAIASLAELDAARAQPLIAPLLGDADPRVRAQAVAALGDGGVDATGLRAAITARLDDVDEVRFEAAIALARQGDRAGVPVLTAALGDRAFRDRAFDAASALARLGASGDTTLLLALATLIGKRFGDPLVKVRAAETLARAHDERGLRYLRRAARARREEVRALARSVLSELDHVS